MAEGDELQAFADVVEIPNRSEQAQEKPPRWPAPKWYQGGHSTRKFEQAWDWNWE